METGNSFERVKKAIHFGYPDRIPIMHAILSGAWLKYGDSLYEIVKKFPYDLASRNLKPSSKRSSASGYSMGVNLTKKYIYEDDFSFIEARNFMYGPNEISERQQDEWNCIWEKIDPGVVGQVVSHPLADWDKWKNYKFPDPLAYWRWDNENFSNIIKESNNMDKYIIGYGGNVFEKMQWLRGYEELMIDICLNQDRVKVLSEKICEYIIGTEKEVVFK